MFCRRDATGNGKQQQFISKSWQKGKVETRLHSCQFSRTAAYLQSSVMFHIQYALCQALKAAILFVDLWSALPLVALPGPLCPHCIWRMLGALPALGGSANCLSTHQIVMSFVFDMLVVQNESNRHHPLLLAQRPTFMHYACDEVAEETRNQCADTATYYKIRLERVP